MSVYSLPLDSEAYIRAALTKGGPAGLKLIKPMHELRAWIHVELAGQTLEVVVDINNTTNSITLQTDDSANAQHVADFIEAIANGTACTAEEAPRHSGLQPPFRNPTAPVDHVEQARDMVNHPPHYTGHPSGVECIEVAEHLPFCLGNAFKYLFRRNDKGSLRHNLEKALWYIRRERAYRTESSAVYMLSDEATSPLGDIIWAEPAPYSHIMELVARGIMLDLAEEMLLDLIPGMPD